MAKFVAVALEGDLRDQLDEIARACGRLPVGEVRFFTDWSSVAPFVKQRGYLAAACSGPWTVLVDDWDVTADIFDDPVLGTALAAQYSTRVVSAFGHSVSGACGFRVHSTSGTRSVVVNQEGVVEDAGEPIPGEEPVDPDDYNEYSVLHALELLGIDIADGVESCSRSALLQFATEPGD